MTLENMFSLMKGRLKFQKVNEELKVPFTFSFYIRRVSFIKHGWLPNFEKGAVWATGK